jgi:Tol biopolymer transport system component
VDGLVKKISGGAYEFRAHSPSITGDGRYVAFVYRGQTHKKEGQGLFIMDRLDGTVKTAIVGSVANPVFAKDGEMIVFESDEANLAPGASSGGFNIFAVKNPFKQ